MLRLALGVTAVAALPLALGLWLQRRFAAGVRRWQAGLERAARLVFALIVLTTFWANRAVMLQHFGSLGAAALALNLGAVAAGLSLRLVGLSAGQALAAAVECGLQNAAIAIFVAVTVLGRTELAVPALIYAVIMNVTALALVGLARRNATA
jgi:BASS family bile acid:Na+ symporter